MDVVLAGRGDEAGDMVASERPGERLAHGNPLAPGALLGPGARMRRAAGPDNGNLHATRQTLGHGAGLSRRRSKSERGRSRSRQPICGFRAFVPLGGSSTPSSVATMSFGQVCLAASVAIARSSGPRDASDARDSSAASTPSAAHAFSVLNLENAIALTTA